MQYRERVVFIAQEINEEFSNQILATLLYLDSIDNTRFLYLYINGPGGEVSNDSSVRRSIITSFCFFLHVPFDYQVFNLLKISSFAAYTMLGSL